MNRRDVALGLLAALAAAPAMAAEPAQRRRRAAPGGASSTSSSSSKPGVAERANRRVGRSTQGDTANSGKSTAANAGAKIDSVLGRSRARR
ncbi:MAG: hypothetical protein JNK67_31185 [Alphaproteobacteria bacterium]|nr:hypothetical protein [Alphaproteobacteria bacterium]